LDGVVQYFGVKLHQVSEHWQRDSVSIVQVLKLRSSSILDHAIVTKRRIDRHADSPG
jgi:hypothetical protein